MINLLPPEIKENIMYARRNTRLLRWLAAGGLAIVGMAAIILFGLFYIDNSVRDLQKNVNTTQESLKSQKLEESQKRVESISGNLKLIVQVLSKQVLFSKLIRQIGSVMPPRTVLSNIELSKLEGGIDLVAKAQDYNSATQVQVNLRDPANKIFEKVDIVSVSCAPSSEDGYPCTVTLRASFTKNNPFLFINNSNPQAKVTP